MPTARKSSRKTQVAPKFADVLNLTRAAFEMALAFRAAKPTLAAAHQERKGKSS